MIESIKIKLYVSKQKKLFYLIPDILIYIYIDLTKRRIKRSKIEMMNELFMLNLNARLSDSSIKKKTEES